MSIQLNAYLTFAGTCKDALTFYAEILNGTTEFMPFGEAPMEMPEEAKSLIMHATLKFGNQILMASDSMPGSPVEKGNNVSLSLAMESVEEGENIFTQLSEGGQVIMPYEKVFWNAMFGMCTDKFGIQWMVNCEL